jgi:prepilin-type N-terminal cleavage/methylation domain-containing protein
MKSKFSPLRHAAKQLRQDSGFTVIELLVVLVIIGILSGIAYVGLSTARQNSIQDTCKSAYQTIYLGVSSYQTDHGGDMPGAITALEPNYVSASTIESFSKNFSMQLGTFGVTQYALTGQSATLTIAYGYPPLITPGEKLVVAGVNPANIDGTWSVSSFTPNPSSNTGTVSFSVSSSATLPNTQAPVGAYLNAISKTGDPFDIYLFNKNGARVGTTAPSACSSL